MGQDRIDLNKAIKNLTSNGKADKLYRDTERSNLYVRVLLSGRKTFQLRKRHQGAMYVESLGEWHEHGPHVEVKQARLKHDVALGKLLDDKAPAKGDRQRTVKQVANAWYAERVEKRYVRPLQTKAYLDRDLSPIESKPIVKVRREDVIRLVQGKPPTAGNRLLAIVKQIFSYAVLNEWLPADPMSILNRDNAGTEEKPRKRVLSDDELRRAWAIPGPHGAIYRMLLCTGQRLSEVLALASDPDQVKGGTWLIDQNKSQRKHKVPVTPLMTKILAEGLPVKKRAAAWQFWAKSRGDDCDATVHDLRRTVASRMKELGIDPTVTEALLNHALPGLQDVYQGSADMQPQILKALTKWHRELLRVVTPA